MLSGITPLKIVENGSSRLKEFRERAEFSSFVPSYKDWEDFHPSPYTYKYFSAPELYGLMRKSFREVKLCGGFPVDHTGTRGEITSLIKRFAVKLHLIPGSLKGRAYLKRIFMGRLIPLPSEITEGMADYSPPTEIPPDKATRDFKIIYAVARK
jgi:hypothetical protein